MKSKIILLLSGIFLTGFFPSCGVLMFREVKCRDFEFKEELKWFAGNVGDVLTFKNNHNETKEFVVAEKYIFHRTKYTTDTGCDCHDQWAILLTAGNDSISMFGDSQYIEAKSAKRSDSFYIKFNNKISGFITEDKSIATNYKVDNTTFAQVLIFEYAYTENNMFKKIVIAPEIGPVELIETNGNAWINTRLETKLNIDIHSFEYSENTCE